MKIARFTFTLAMIWASFRMIADLTARTTRALWTPAVLAFTFWILWGKH